jgi:cytochrome P450
MVTRLPPGPKGHFLLGHIPDYRRGQLEFLERCAREYGDIVRLRLGYHRIFLVNYPDAIEEVLVTKSRNFIKHFALRLTPALLGNGLLLSEGDFYLRQRRMVQPAFLRARLARYAPIMVEAAQNILATWQPGEIRDIAREMMRITLEIAARTLFGSVVARETREIDEALQFLQESYLARFNSFYPMPLWIPSPVNLRMRTAVRRLDQIIYRFIDQRRQSGTDRGDLLSLLLHARDEDDGGGMSDRQVRDEAMTIFLAGHETTALALSWTWYLLATHPELEQRLATEVQGALVGRVPTIDDLPRLRYTEWVVQEAMRLYPPIYTIGREAVAECEVGGYHVPRGTTILMNQWIVHRDRRFFDHPGTLGRGFPASPPEVCLLPIWRRSTALPGQQLCYDGSDAGPGHNRTELPLHAAAWTSGCSLGPSHAASPGRHPRGPSAPGGSAAPRGVMRIKLTSRLSGQEPAQILRQSRGAGRATVWLLFQTREADGFERGRDGRLQAARGHRQPRRNLREYLLEGRA